VTVEHSNKYREDSTCSEEKHTNHTVDRIANGVPMEVALVQHATNCNQEDCLVQKADCSVVAEEVTDFLFVTLKVLQLRNLDQEVNNAQKWRQSKHYEGHRAKILENVERAIPDFVELLSEGIYLVKFHRFVNELGGVDKV
jgi:hypothetical protein